MLRVDQDYNWKLKWCHKLGLIATVIEHLCFDGVRRHTTLDLHPLTGKVIADKWFNSNRKPTPTYRQRGVLRSERTLLLWLNRRTVDNPDARSTHKKQRSNTGSTLRGTYLFWWRAHSLFYNVVIAATPPPVINKFHLCTCHRRFCIIILFLWTLDVSWCTCGRKGHYPRIDYSSGTLIRWNKRDTDRCPAKRQSLCKQEDDRELKRAKGADQRSREVNLLNQAAPAGIVFPFCSIGQRMRHFVAIMGSLGPWTIHCFLNTRIACVRGQYFMA